jgi:hypothetical protein
MRPPPGPALLALVEPPLAEALHSLNRAIRHATALEHVLDALPEPTAAERADPLRRGDILHLDDLSCVNHDLTGGLWALRMIQSSLEGVARADLLDRYPEKESEPPVTAAVLRSD